MFKMTFDRAAVEEAFIDAVEDRIKAEVHEIRVETRHNDGSITVVVIEVGDDPRPATLPKPNQPTVEEQENGS